MQVLLNKIPKKYRHYIEAIHNLNFEVSVDLKEGFVGSDNLHGWIMDSWDWEHYTSEEMHKDLNNFLSTVKPE